tara:strand:- start:558 stop:1040 length:483 start_codon:yes stop_codon:yes gene_type:complete
MEKDGSKILRSYRDEVVTKIELGDMYLYRYLPKHRKTLPYYDLYPMIIAIDYRKGGFVGVNLHYIPPKYRVILLNNLKNTVKTVAGRDIFKIKYPILAAAKKYAYAMPCIKHYKYSQLKSMVRRIPSEEWSLASILPIEKFKKESKQTVWKESINRARRS